MQFGLLASGAAVVAAAAGLARPSLAAESAEPLPSFEVASACQNTSGVRRNFIRRRPGDSTRQRGPVDVMVLERLERPVEE